jgi:hypothetical protein
VEEKMTEETKTEETKPCETKFDKRINSVVDGFADAVKEVATGINHLTDDIADAVGDVFKGVKEAVGGEPAVRNEDLDPTNKIGK